MEALPNLKMISCNGVGYDSIDAKAAVRRGINVSHTPNAQNDDVATTAVLLMLACYRELLRDDAHVRSGRWETQGGAPSVLYDDAEQPDGALDVPPSTTFRHGPAPTAGLRGCPFAEAKFDVLGPYRGAEGPGVMSVIQRVALYLRALKENARQGFWNGPCPPVGYRTAAAETRGAKVKKNLEIDPLRAATVRLAFRLARVCDGTSNPIGLKAIASHRIFTRDGDAGASALFTRC